MQGYSNDQWNEVEGMIPFNLTAAIADKAEKKLRAFGYVTSKGYPSPFDPDLVT